MDKNKRDDEPKPKLDEIWADKSRITLVGLILIGVPLLVVIGADGMFDRILTPRNRYFPDMTGMRIGMVACSGMAGFALGWFFSPQAKALRAMLGVLAFIIMLILVVADHGALGWSTASLLAAASFVAGLGYWTSKAAKRFMEPVTTFGSAAWATFQELLANGLLSCKGFKVGKFSSPDGMVDLYYPRDRHLLSVAPNRSGKGTTMIIPNLLSYGGSIVVIDPKGENAMITAEHRKSMKQKVYAVDPWGITGMETACFNPLDWLQKGDVDLTENAMIAADALIVPSNGNEQFWDEEAKALLQGIIVYVVTDDYEDGNRTLGRVRDLLLLDGTELTALFKRMLQSEYHIVRSTGARCLQKEEKLLANVLASVQAQTHFLDSVRIRESLSRSDFKFEDLKTDKMTIYLVLPSDRLNTFGRWLRLLIQQSLTVNARNIEIKPDMPVLFILDEMAALGRLTMVEQAFGLMAGYGIQLWGIVQDLSQLKRIYGDGWETFISNAGMIQYFGSRDRLTAEYFSALCGVTTVWNLSTAISRAFGTSHSHQGGLTTSKTITASETTASTQRKLAYPDELMRLHEGKQLLLIENGNPIEAYKVPWFEDPDLKDLGRNLHTENQ